MKKLPNLHIRQVWEIEDAVNGWGDSVQTVKVRTIRNMERISKEGMTSMDDLLLNIMLNKQGDC